MRPHKHELDKSPSMIHRSPRRRLPSQTVNEAAKSISQPRSSKDKSSKADKDTAPRTWLCLCEQGIGGDCEDKPECMCMRYLENNPGHPYLITKKGDNIFRWWQNEATDRDPEWWEIDPKPNPKRWSEFRDFGIVEILANMLRAFDRVWSWEIQDTWLIWAQIEGMARFFTGCYYGLYLLGDAIGNAKLVMLIGTSILTTIDHLVKEGMFADGSEIKNIGFILGLLLNVFFRSGGGTRGANEDGWGFFVIKRALQHGVTIRSNAKIHDILNWKTLNRQILIRMRQNNEDEATKRRNAKAEISDKGTVEHEVKLLNVIKAYRPNHATESNLGVQRSWDAWDWKQEFAAYIALYGEDGKIGGSYYDLSDPENRILLAARLLYGADRIAVAAFVHDAETESVREPSVEVPD
ncbi:MAG: hypothetical protein Q9212_004660 [Teloschistes hypoglaucus]